MQRHFPWHIVVFLAPAMLIYSLFRALPLLDTLRLGFFTTSETGHQTSREYAKVGTNQQKGGSYTIYHKPDSRSTVEGMFYRMRVGCPCRDLPSAFGKWNFVYKRFNAWSAAGTWLNIFKALLVDPDFEWELYKGSSAQRGCSQRSSETIGKTTL
jgi:transposase